VLGIKRRVEINQIHTLIGKIISITQNLEIIAVVELVQFGELLSVSWEIYQSEIILTRFAG
jgi:hypothetical protein